jgi:Lrp/AsnC family transcriptional regulator for asnA, asnC and gidA
MLGVGWCGMLDNLDFKIVELLGKNGGAANFDIAKKLGVSEGTIRNRIKKLIEEKFLAVKGLINPEKIKEKRIIFIGAKVTVSKDLEETAQKISCLDQVSSVSILTGRYDLLIELFIEPFKIIEFIGRELSKIGSIASTESHVTLKTYKKWI